MHLERATRQVKYNKSRREPICTGPKLEEGEDRLVDYQGESEFCDLPQWGSALPVLVSVVPSERPMEEDNATEIDEDEYVEAPENPSPAPQNT
ncbi:hypothetical protein SMACR_03074 [Sordaria macrospora]|uniref:WGS project CABT00000000 data, contig 2.7 n=2 Tax=Sordaria macrospora TaxID=5147 RepID=F7VUA9_SORMK|nr:uncharacterized protein SMAC_03074 [Sordaria macrospora k-hell]KAA8632491.1 hypothetical protein SMACR_03074 [Sordaria macrospora]WPJ61911.1 hypothetical protein SMAC4_03074 [Sordaria macrospora]CCC09097.1 unnamed protein product [Sordaria macrospora k-hell]